LQHHLKIHDLTMEDIVHQNQRPKLDSFDDYVYLAVHPL
jgi:Mg2+ and Co2+ transporter CorA